MIGELLWFDTQTNHGMSFAFLKIEFKDFVNLFIYQGKIMLGVYFQNPQTKIYSYNEENNSWSLTSIFIPLAVA